MVKHHTMNQNLMRNGCDFCVYLSTQQEFGGSDSGQRPDEQISWGKIRVDANPVKLHGEATCLLPLIVQQTFYKNLEKERKEKGAASYVGEKDEKLNYDPALIYNKEYTTSEHAIERQKLDKLGLGMKNLDM